MTLTLDNAAENLLQRELERGRFSGVNELITHALLLVEAEQRLPSQAEMDDWLSRNKDAVRKSLEESFAAEARGDVYSPEETRAALDAHRSQRNRTA